MRSVKRAAHWGRRRHRSYPSRRAKLDVIAAAKLEQSLEWLMPQVAHLAQLLTKLGGCDILNRFQELLKSLRQERRRETGKKQK